MNIVKGVKEQYHWMETNEFQFWKIVETYPELVLNNYIMINAFDGGPLIWNDEKIAKGFSYLDGVVMTSKLTSLNDIRNLPSEFNDEWYISTKPFKNAPTDIFVNYGLFTLRVRDYEKEKGTIDKTWDFKGLEHDIEVLTELQDQFWTTLNKVDPDKFIGQKDDKFIFVTKDLKEIQKLEKYATTNNL